MIISLFLSFQLNPINFIFITCLTLIVFLSYLSTLNELNVSILINPRIFTSEKNNYYVLQAYCYNPSILDKQVLQLIFSKRVNFQVQG